MYLVEYEGALGKWKAIWKVYKKEDPNFLAYGIRYCSHDPCNLKTKSKKKGYLSAKEPIYLEYDRDLHTVTVSSSKFEFYQEKIPEEKTYAIGVKLTYKG